MYCDKTTAKVLNQHTRIPCGTCIYNKKKTSRWSAQLQEKYIALENDKERDNKCVAKRKKKHSSRAFS